MRRLALFAGAGALLLAAAVTFWPEEPDEACSSCDARHKSIEERRAATEKLRAAIARE